MWDMLISDPIAVLLSLVAYPVLAFLVIQCIYAISINDNRLDEMRFVEQRVQQNAQRIASFAATISPLISNSHPGADDFRATLKEAQDLRRNFWSLSYKRIYGDENARHKAEKLEKAKEQEKANDPEKVKEPEKTKEQEKANDPETAKEAKKVDHPKRRFVDRFHANSDTTNIMIIGLSACTIALCATKLLGATKVPDPSWMKVFLSVTIFDVALGILTGLLTTFVVKSGSSALSSTSLGAIDVSNPYGVAFVAAVVGLFMDRFYSWLVPVSAAMRSF